uniref:Tissue factor pathway inhibitor n=1 Tax=Jaculus jaculus TaxID=51337 RepID=A0A8C5LLJ8_JACJA
IMHILKKKHVFWMAVCLLLSLAPECLKAFSDEEEDYEEISDSTLPPRKPKHTFCGYKADIGPCRALLKRYFYNIFTGKCEEFIYGGCLGNKNRFETLEECKSTCVIGKPYYCFLEDDTGICRGFYWRYFYNHTSKQCERFVYGGCLGNQNNFESLEACNNTCANPPANDTQVNAYKSKPNTINKRTYVMVPKPTKASRLWEYRGPSWCRTPADSGLCKASVNRFYYNATIGRCLPFKYTGCGGNENNFVSKQSCFKACRK